MSRWTVNAGPAANSSSSDEYTLVLLSCNRDIPARLPYYSPIQRKGWQQSFWLVQLVNRFLSLLFVKHPMKHWLP